MSNSLNCIEYQKKVRTLLFNLNDHNGGWSKHSNFQTMQFDLLGFAFPEFLASKTFTELSGERRKEIFDQYNDLKETLDLLHNFFPKLECD